MTQHACGGIVQRRADNEHPSEPVGLEEFEREPGEVFDGPTVFQRVRRGVEDGVGFVAGVEVVEPGGGEPQAHRLTPGIGQVDRRTQVSQRRRTNAEWREEIEVVFGLVPVADPAAVGQAVGEGPVEQERLAVTDAAGNFGGPGGELTGLVGMQVDDGVGLPAREFARPVAAWAVGRSGGSGREGDEAVEQRVAFEQRAHRLARDENQALIRELRAERCQAGRGEEDVANAVGAAEKEGGQKEEG